MKTQVRAEVTISAPQDQVWEILSDLESLPQYDAEIVKSTILSENRRGLGAERQLDLPDGGYLRERIVAWQEGGGYSLEVYEESTSMPLTDQVVHFRLDPVQPEQTRVSLIFEYVLEDAREADRDMFAGEAGQLLNHLLAGLKKRVETGIPLNDSQPA